MTDYPLDMQLVVDPLNPQNVVRNGAVYLYDADDTAGVTPIAIKDTSGLPLANPLMSNAYGFTQPCIVPLPRVKWKSGSFEGFFYSYDGLRNEAVAAKEAAQTAAGAASEAVGSTVSMAAVNGSGRLILTKADSSTVDAGSVVGPQGSVGPTGAQGPTGSQGPAGPQTTDASLLTAGTLADARLPTRLSPGELSATYAMANPVVASVVLDANGNRTSWTENGVACSATYDSNENMLTLTVGAVTRTFSYDANGNMTGAE